MKILLVGGGTGGSVAPLLAVAEEIKNKHAALNPRFLFIGTSRGPENIMARHAGINFLAIPAGKLRRYFSLSNFFAPFFVIAGFVKSFFILRGFKPDVVFGTGSFAQVPPIWAAWLMRIPVVIHQQDVVPSLANKLCQFCARKITVTFEKSLKDFSSNLGIGGKNEQKVFVTGNPFRTGMTVVQKEEAVKVFGLNASLPTLFVTGGGTGSLAINELVEEAGQQLVKTVQIIHSTGRGMQTAFRNPNYHQFEFISNMGAAFAAADIVLCRAGLSTITELSCLGKVAIMIPMPDSHQVQNADFLGRKQAAKVLPQEMATPDLLVNLVKKILFDRELQLELRHNISRIMPKDAAKRLAKIIFEIAARD